MAKTKTGKSAKSSKSTKSAKTTKSAKAKASKAKKQSAPSASPPPVFAGGLPQLGESKSSQLRAEITITHDEILKARTDAVVIPANTDLILGAGIAALARRKGGDVIQKECKKIGSIGLGQAVITTSGKLRCKYLVHAACLGLGQKTTEKDLMDAVQNALKRGTEKACRSIAFPAMGMTEDDFPVKRCAEIMISEVQKHLDGGTAFEVIQFCVPDPIHFRAFESSLAEIRD